MAEVEDVAEHFKAVTGCADDAEARQFLEACNGHLPTAVDLYFHKQSDMPVDASVVPGTSGLRRERKAHKAAANHASTLARKNNSRLNGTVASKSESSKDLHSIDDDYIRAPIGPVRGPIVEQSFAEQYQVRNRKNNSSSIFDRYRDFRAEGAEQLAMLKRISSGTGDRRVTLQALFRPPIEITYRGSWEAARGEAQRQSLWLLVNVQNVEEFACQTLNRDVWANAAVKELIRSNFLFWQIYHDSADGIRLINYYRVDSFPAIFVVDPRTGELLTTFRAQDAVSFCDQVTTFLDRFPDYAARDRQLIGAAAPPPFSEPEAYMATDEVERNQSNDNGLMVPGSSRKRNIDSGDSSDDSSQPCCSKKSRQEDENMSDIDALVNVGSKLTTVDKDEWQNYLGSADGRGICISLLLRLPDGSRHKVQMEDTTTLKAIFMLVSGFGYSPSDHLLVLSYPKREFSLEDNDRTLREAGFIRQEVIHVERK